MRCYDTAEVIDCTALSSSCAPDMIYHLPSPISQLGNNTSSVSSVYVWIIEVGQSHVWGTAHVNKMSEANLSWGKRLRRVKSHNGDIPRHDAPIAVSHSCVVPELHLTF